MAQIGVSYYFPELNKYIGEIRDMHNKYSVIPPHITVYLSDIKRDQINESNFKKVINILRKPMNKIVLNRMKKIGKVLAFDIKNTDHFKNVQRSLNNIFNTTSDTDFHISVAYKSVIKDGVKRFADLKKIEKELTKLLPLTVLPSAFSIAYRVDKRKEFKLLYEEQLK